MAIEKVLNTRIQLKYDSFGNWSSNNPELKAGEVAIAYLTTAGAIAPSASDTQHPVLFKVGPGHFNDLPWASALAADVHTWAKKSEADFKTWVKDLIEVTDIDAYSKAQVDSLLSANATADKAYADSAAATAKSEAIAAAATDATTKVNTLKNNEVKANADAIAAIKDHASVDSFNDVMTEMAKYQIAGDYATKADAQGYANAKDSAIAEAKKAGTDAAAALEAYKTSNNQALADEIARAKAAEAKALTDAKAYADDLKDSILGEGISETFDTLKEIQTWIEGDGVNATELSGAIAAEAKLRADEDSRLEDLIDANAEAIAALNAADGKVANAAYADKANSLTDAAKEEVKAVKVNNATNADVANSLTDNAKAEVKAVKVDNAAHADTADNAAKLGGVAAADYATKAYADQAEADAIASANANTADVIKNYYTKSEADAAFMDSTETGSAIDAKITALNLSTTYEPIGAETRAKAYANGLAKNYATAAQGAKADSALQNIEVGTGLKVSGKANNKQTIEIDTDVVFVFNCGSASVLVD